MTQCHKCLLINSTRHPNSHIEAIDLFAGESKSSKHFGIGSVSHQTITQGRNKIWSGLEEQFHVLFVFVTESMVPKTSRGFASDVVIVDASNLDKYASPVTIDIRRVGSHDRKRPRST